MKKQQVDKLNHCTYSLNYHLVIVTKYRRKCITSAMLARLKIIREEYLSHIEKFYYKKPIFWSRSYCILTCGGAPLSIIKQYIQQQSSPQ